MAARGAQLARVVLDMARGAVRLDGEDGRGVEEVAMTMNGWQPTRMADEVSHHMVHESLHYSIYA